MNCWNCGKEIPNGSNYCEFCGVKLNSKCRNNTALWLCLSAIAVASIVVIFLFLKPNDDNNSINEKRVTEVINRFNDAYALNDFATLSSVYANKIERFHDAYNLNNSEVVEKYRRYDSKFGVYGKHINVKWNTLQIELLPNDDISVVFIEDFSIDRVDNSKYSIFVLEEHIVLNSDYKIKSIYDVQLSKTRK